MGARQEDLRAARLPAHVIDIGADAVADLEDLARQQLVAAQRGFAPAEVHDHIAVFDALDRAVDDLADAVLVFVILPVALGLAHLLHDHLLGRLRGDAAEVEGRQRVGDGVADLGSRVVPAGAGDVDLDRRILNLVDHQQMAGKPQLAGARIDLGVDVRLRAVTRAGGLGDRIFHGGDDDAPVDRFLARDRIGDLQEFEPVCADHGHQLISFAVDLRLALDFLPGLAAPLGFRKGFDFCLPRIGIFFGGTMRTAMPPGPPSSARS